MYRKQFWNDWMCGTVVSHGCDNALALLTSPSIPRSTGLNNFEFVRDFAANGARSQSHGEEASSVAGSVLRDVQGKQELQAKLHRLQMEINQVWCRRCF
jgi:hypothetical protein